MQNHSQRNATSDAAQAALKGIQELKEQWLWWPSFWSRYQVPTDRYCKHAIQRLFFKITGHSGQTQSPVHVFLLAKKIISSVIVVCLCNSQNRCANCG